MAFSLNGMCGWLGQSCIDLPPGTLAAMEVPLRTQDRSPRVSTDAFGACAPKGWVLSADDGIQLAVCGTPYFAETELTDIGREQNPGAAVLAAYRAHGSRCIEKMRGAFALALYDVDKQLSLLATDRLARQTLYYSLADGALVFASSADSVRAHPGVDTSIDPQSVFNYVYFHMVPSPGSIYTDIQKMPAAHCLIGEAGKTRLENYWLPVFCEQSTDSGRDPGAEMLDVLQRAVGRQSGDRQLGAFLSGGLDSSSVAGMLAKNAADTAVFSIGFDAEGYDEMAYARIAARHFGLRQHEYYVTRDDVVDAVPKIAAHYDEPFGNSSALPTYLCARLAAQNGVDCLLAGDGGDEIFAGNERYAKQAVFERYWRLPGVVRKHFVEPVARAMPDRGWLIKKGKSYIDQAKLPLPDRLQTYNYLHRHPASEIFNAGFLDGVDTGIPIRLQRDVYQRPLAATQLNRMLYMDWQFTLADNDLRKVNHMCALGGVDVVYPMLDDELVDFSCRIPSAIKMKGNRLRDFYKHAVTGFLPDATINKSKHGFGLPFGVWMQTHQPLREMCYDNLLNLKQRGYIRPEFIDHAIAMHADVHAAFYGELMWVLMMLELWLDSRKL